MKTISLKAIIPALDRFFFSEEDIRPMGVFRAFFGFLVLINGIMLFQERMDWFSDVGVMTYQTARAYTGGVRLDLFAVWPRTDFGITSFVGLHVLFALTLMLGLFTRVSAAVVFLTLVTMHHRNALMLNSADTIMRVMSFLVVFSPAGNFLSLDRWLAKRRGKDLPQRAPAWSWRLMQIQFCLIYISTTAWKLSGNAWLDGTATYYSARLVDFQRLKVGFLFDTWFGIKLTTWASLFVEGLMGIGVWITELRLLTLLLGVGLHLGIELTMNIPLFEWLMICMMGLFVRGDELEWAYRAVMKRIRRGALAK